MGTSPQLKVFVLVAKLSSQRWKGTDRLKFSAEQRAYLVLKEIAALNLEGHINATRSAGSLVGGQAVKPLINEKLEYPLECRQAGR